MDENNNNTITTDSQPDEQIIKSENSQATDKPWLFKKGQSGNPGGRPKGGLKDFDRRRFIEMSDEEKIKFLDKISPELRYKMAEGNPPQVVEGNEDKPLIIKITNSIAEQNGISIDTNTRPDSEGQDEV